MSDFSQKSAKGLGPLPSEHEPSILRAVRLHGQKGSYYLIVWDTGAKSEYGQPHLGYRFVMPDGTVLWQGTGYQPGMSHGDSLDSDDVLRRLISMITDDPETSGGEFEGWTPAQLAFAGSEEGKTLNMDYGEDFEVNHVGEGGRFKDLPGYEHTEGPYQDE